MTRILRAIAVAVAVAVCAGTGCSSRGGDHGVVIAHTGTCLPGERGYFRASLRGALDAEPDWRGAGLQCEGGARPEGRGLRVSFLGPADASGRQLRFVFGIAAAPGVGMSRAAPTNVTVIVEGQRQLYATQGDDKCAVEALTQEPVPAVTPAAAGAARLYRVAARGYCIDPAATLDGSARLYINRFDFAGQARFEDNEVHAAAAHD